MRLILFIATVLIFRSVQGQEFRCSLGKLESAEEEYCIFRDVTSTTGGAKFSYPTGVPKPTRVAFENSNLKQVPADFLRLAGAELKVLRVENCGLESVTISSGLESLYAKGNAIEKVIVHQSGTEGPLRILDLSQNQMTDIKNVTNCKNLEILNLSGNTKLFSDLLELQHFKGMNSLRELHLAHNDITYIDNTDDTNLESLELLDLSHNNLITSDLQMKVFYPLTKLHTLRLNDNLMADLSYNHLRNIKSLKTIYLNGNNFDCTYLERMLTFLQQININTPTEPTLYSCKTQIMDGMCCTGQLPPKPTVKPMPGPTTVDPISPGTITTTERANIPSGTDQREGTDGGGPPSWMWYAIGAGVAVLVLAIAGIIVWRKKATSYRVPPGNLELS